MKSVLLIGLCAIIAALSSCKVKRQDTEITFPVSIVQKKGFRSDTLCFDEIHAIGFGELNDKCIDSLDNGFLLPLNIATDTTSFEFRRENIRDTITLKYKLAVKERQGEYYMELISTDLIKCTFDSIKVKKIKHKEHKKDDFAAIEGISIYF